MLGGSRVESFELVHALLVILIVQMTLKFTYGSRWTTSPTMLLAMLRIWEKSLIGGREKHGEKMMKTLDNRQLLDRLTEQLASYRFPVALGFSQALIQRDTAVSCKNARTDSRGST